MRRIISILIFLLLVCTICIAQNPDQEDSVPDTLKIYHSIERFAKKKKITYMLYKAVFNLPGSSKPDTVRHAADNYERYGGKIIRNIIIETLDPFGYQVRDTSIKPRSFIQKGGNILHDKSSQFTIKNQLLIRKGKPLDPLELKESERLIRQSSYVKDLVITVKRVRRTDSVDVFIREQDLWTIGVGIGVSSSQETVLYKDKNFAGLSHQIDARGYYYNNTKKNIVEGNYTIPYLKNTYMTVKGAFTSNPDNYTNGVSLNRPFYSPLTKWAWGADYLFHGTLDSLQIIDAPSIGYKVHYNDLDLWLGRSFLLTLSNSIESRSTKLITAGRFLNRNYSLLPPLAADSSHLTGNSQFYVGSIGISNRTYYRDYYIYRFGIPEDVPAGRLEELLVGYEQRARTGRIYLGALTGFGHHYDHLGYVSVLVGYGTFLRSGRTEQSVVNGTVGYFSNLLQISSWRLRQFIKMQCVYGIDRKSGELITINNDNGIKGFDSPTLKGTNKFIITLQSQLYLPYSLLGFRFAPFIFCNFGMLGSNNVSLFSGRLYQGYGLGLIIKNELLTISTFQFSIGLYPYIPGVENGWFKYSPINSYDFTFRDFDIQKPAEVVYQ